jgi:hypothetical protein
MRSGMLALQGRGGHIEQEWEHCSARPPEHGMDAKNITYAAHGDMISLGMHLHMEGMMETIACGMKIGVALLAGYMRLEGLGK